jgi:hypothetical protein
MVQGGGEVAEAGWLDSARQRRRRVVAGGGSGDFLEQEGEVGVREGLRFGERRAGRCSTRLAGGTMAVVASIPARRGRLRWCEVDKRRPGVERLATTSLLSWLSHREVSSGVRRSGSSMPK